MKNVSLALATALAITLGSVPASVAQPSEKNVQGDSRPDYQSDTAGDRERSDDGGDRGREFRWDPRQDAGRDAPPRWHDDRRGPRMGHMDNDAGQHMAHHMRRHMGEMAGGRGPMVRGARFRIVKGDARIDIQCPPQNDMQSCVQAAGELLDRIGKRDDSPAAAPPADRAPSRM
jgi:hypothetical protein